MSLKDAALLPTLRFMMQMAVPSGRHMLLDVPLLLWAMVAIIAVGILYGLLALFKRCCHHPYNAYSLDSGESGGAHHRPLTYSAPDSYGCAQAGDDDQQEAFVCDMPPHAASSPATKERFSKGGQDKGKILGSHTIHTAEVIPVGRQQKLKYAFEAPDDEATTVHAALRAAKLPLQTCARHVGAGGQQLTKGSALTPRGTLVAKERAGKHPPTLKYSFAALNEELPVEKQSGPHLQPLPKGHAPAPRDTPLAYKKASTHKQGPRFSIAAYGEELTAEGGTGSHRQQVTKRPAAGPGGTSAAVEHSGLPDERLEYGTPGVNVAPTQEEQAGNPRQQVTKYTVPVSAIGPQSPVVGKRLRHRKDGPGIENSFSLPKTSVGCF
jgi:hypothetical protein